MLERMQEGPSFIRRHSRVCRCDSVPLCDWTMRLVQVIAAVSAARQNLDDTPVQKVVTMLERMQEELESEGRKEAETYNEYACFCKDMTAEKSGDIVSQTTSKEEIEGDLATHSTDRDNKLKDIEDNEKDIKSTQADLDEERKEWKEFVEQYEKEHKEISDAVAALSEVKTKLTAMKEHVTSEGGTALLQKLLPLVKSASRLRRVRLHAASVAALQRKGDGDEAVLDVPDSDYEFKGGDILTTIEGLKTDFETSKTDMEADFTTKEDAHKEAVQGFKDSLETLNDTLADNKQQLADINKDLAADQKKLTLTSASLHDDQEYLVELTKQCNAKAELWSQRSGMRAEELGALVEAIDIIKGKVSDKDDVNQEGHGKRVLLQKRAAARRPESSRVTERLDGSLIMPSIPFPATFLQTAGTHNKRISLLRRGPDAAREAVLTLLRSKAEVLHSPQLSALAEAASSDPFAKIKTLIQQMIERLLAEAGDDAEHTGWCNTEMEKTKTKRAHASEHTERLSAEIHELEANRDSLEKANHTLTVELEELRVVLANATDTRAEEKSENAEAIADAKEGKEAVSKAITTLKRFYKKAAKAKSFVIIGGPSDDAPAGGFDSEYGGAQGKASGVIGMLEVIESDFERTITETQKAEKQSREEFVELRKQSNISIRQKETTKSRVVADLAETKIALSDHVDDLKEQQGLLNAAIRELEKLKPACVDLGKVSPEERAAAREEEIQALRQALCILDDPESSCD
mmetsp:Transcript_2051/g.4877  ORF Transcript_2051/g.4877 Transcript_2051/m.4877 type:complete len:748 (-) Transcript_2051:47-2290(-)